MKTYEISYIENGRYFRYTGYSWSQTLALKIHFMLQGIDFEVSRED